MTPVKHFDILLFSLFKIEVLSMAKEIMTVEEVARYLRTGVATIYKLAQEGRIPATKVGNQWRFRKETIDEWLDKGGKSSLKNSKKGG